MTFVDEYQEGTLVLVTPLGRVLKRFSISWLEDEDRGKIWVYTWALAEFYLQIYSVCGFISPT